MTRYFDELNQTFVTIDYIQTDSRLLRRYRYDNAPNSFVVIPVRNTESHVWGPSKPEYAQPLTHTK